MDLPDLCPSWKIAACVQALPPHFQELREKEAILKDPRLFQFLGNAQIVEIRKIASGYLVRTETEELRVDVHYLPQEPGFCGPARFELLFQSTEPLVNKHPSH